MSGLEDRLGPYKLAIVDPDGTLYRVRTHGELHAAETLMFTRAGLHAGRGACLSSTRNRQAQDCPPDDPGLSGVVHKLDRRNRS